MAKKFDLSAYVNPMESKLDTDEIQHISLDRIRCNAGNFYAVENVDDLVDSIKLTGLLQPLLVVPAEDGDYRLISGHRRFKAIRYLYEESNFVDWGKAPCIVLPDPKDGDKEQLMLIHANSTGRVLSGAEIQRQGREIREILVRMKDNGVEIPGRLRDVVAEQMQISSSRLARLDAIDSKLVVPGIREAWERGELNESAAYELTQLMPEKQYKFLDRVIDEGKAWSEVSIKDVQEFGLNKVGPTKQQIALACERLGLDGMEEFEMLKTLVRRCGIRPNGSVFAFGGIKDLAVRLKDRYRNSYSGSDAACYGGCIGENKFKFEGKLLGFSYRVSWTQLAEAVAMVAVEDGAAEMKAETPAVSKLDTGWRRCYSEEPEEGQTVMLADPQCRMWCEVAVYADGSFVDRDGGVIEEISSAMFWRPFSWPDWSAGV